ncbi:unnamed protein product [Callosobruchus maculatus]|uniref:Uncharacterized protein n=1 Tax=Callosobruchus maculatus TaxID=64391 RepID=A0A653BGI7_CALMS|nr:unnamed protein product [Callosobruchus maculatus]
MNQEVIALILKLFYLSWKSLRNHSMMAWKIGLRYTGHKTEDMQIESAIITNDNFVLSGSKTGELFCWDLVSAEIVKKYIHTPNKVLNSLSVHPRKDVVLTACVGSIKLWGGTDDIKMEEG